MIRSSRLVAVIFLLTSALIASAEPAPPVTVSSINGYLLTVRFSGRSVQYGEGEGICIYRNRKAVACGYVMMADDRDVEIRLTRGSNRFTPREKLLVRSSPKYGKSDGGGSSRSSSSDRGTALALGTTLYGPKSIFFAAHLTLAFRLSPSIALGLQPFYSSSGAELSSMGGYGLLYVFFDKPFDGLYGVGGLGAFFIKGKAVDSLLNVVEESVTSISVKAALGYRVRFGGNWHAGFEGGLQYLSKTQGEQLNFGYNSLNGLLLAEIGLLF